MDSASELIGLSYGSRATFETGRGRVGVDPEVARILIRSRRNNRAMEIGGVLHFGNGCFFQYIEGPADDVDALYARICRDPRHSDVRRLTRRPIPRRRFSDWSMKFVAIERVVEVVMQRHGLDGFDPYSFTPAIVDDLVMSCIALPEDAPNAVPDASAREKKRSLWQRLTGRG